MDTERNWVDLTSLSGFSVFRLSPHAQSQSLWGVGVSGAFETFEVDPDILRTFSMTFAMPAHSDHSGRTFLLSVVSLPSTPNYLELFRLPIVRRLLSAQKLGK